MNPICNHDDIKESQNKVQLHLFGTSSSRLSSMPIQIQTFNHESSIMSHNLCDIIFVS